MILQSAHHAPKLDLFRTDAEGAENPRYCFVAFSWGLLHSKIWPWVKTNGTILGYVGAPPILKPILVGIGMFTGGAIWILTHGHMAGGQEWVPNCSTW